MEVNLGLFVSNEFLGNIKTLVSLESEVHCTQDSADYHQKWSFSLLC